MMLTLTLWRRKWRRWRHEIWMWMWMVLLLLIMMKRVFRSIHIHI